MPSTITLMGVNSWYGDHDPTNSETTNLGTIAQYDNYFNYLTGRTWMNTDPTIGALVWLAYDGTLAEGTATLSLGTATVLTPSVSSSTPILLRHLSPGGTPGAKFISSMTSGTGFNIASTSLLDSSVVHWRVLAY